MSAAMRRRWGPFDWAIATTGVLVAAAAFVGLLVYDRVLFLVALTVITTNVLTWRVTRTAMRAEAEAARTRLDALDLTPAGGQPTVLGNDLDPPVNLFPAASAPVDLPPPQHPNPSTPPDHVTVWRTFDTINRGMG